MLLCGVGFGDNASGNLHRAKDEQLAMRIVCRLPALPCGIDYFQTLTKRIVCRLPALPCGIDRFQTLTLALLGRERSRS